MGKVKVESSEKIKAVENYLKGEASMRMLAKSYGVHHSSVEKWIRLYRTFGRKGFEDSKHYQSYPEELKQQAIKMYRDTDRSLLAVCEQLGIRSVSVLQYWLRKYKPGDENTY